MVSSTPTTRHGHTTAEDANDVPAWMRPDYEAKHARRVGYALTAFWTLVAFAAWWATG